MRLGHCLRVRYGSLQMAAMCAQSGVGLSGWQGVVRSKSFELLWKSFDASWTENARLANLVRRMRTDYISICERLKLMNPRRDCVAIDIVDIIVCVRPWGIGFGLVSEPAAAWSRRGGTRGCAMIPPVLPYCGRVGTRPRARFKLQLMHDSFQVVCFVVASC